MHRRRAILISPRVGRPTAFWALAAFARDLLLLPVVIPLDDVFGDVPPSPAERYRRRERHRTKHYEKGGSGELHCYAEFGQGGEDRVDDDRVTGDARQDVAARGSSYDPREEVGQEGGEDKYEDRRDYARDVGNQLCQDLGYLLDTQGVRGHGYGNDEHEPECGLAEDRCRGLTGLGPGEELLYAASLHPAVETHRLQYPRDDGLKDLGHDVAHDQYDDGADQLRHEGEERVQTCP